MLDKLYIKNFALIDELEVELYNGLNVLSGETGAGKSIIIGSLNFVLGGKADKSIIKSGAKSTEVSALIYVESEELRDTLRNKDVEIDDDNYILLKRTFNTNGKSNCKINGKNLTVGMVKEVSSYLVDIHGQHEHQSLLNTKSHLVMLDKLCSDKLNEPLHKLKEMYLSYKEVSNKLKEIDLTDKSIKERVELYKYQISEIESATLLQNEDEELMERRNLLAYSGRIMDNVYSTLDLILRGEDAALNKIGEAISHYNTVVTFDDSQRNILEALNDCYSILDDSANDIKSYESMLEFDPSELDKIEERLQLIYDLKKKYGNTIEDINNYANELSNRLSIIENSEALAKEYINTKKTIEKDIRKVCNIITSIRKETALFAQKEIENILKELSMENAKFEIRISEKEGFDEKGLDIVEFLISANKGEEPKPLIKIASGGEMSRVMLALKTVLASVDTIDTFIFDEIDTGISGRTAQRVAEKMAVIANTHQVICISHLPQIAAMADKNFLIEKYDNNSSTTTNIVELNGEKVYNELARLIGGAEITTATINAAKEMKFMAKNIREAR